MAPELKAKELLQIEIDELTRQLIARKEALKLLDELNGSGPRFVSSIPTSNKYQGGKIREHILSILAEAGAPMRPADIAERLVAGGAWLGKDPKRYVAMLKITITQNPDLLVLENEVVARKK